MKKFETSYSIVSQYINQEVIWALWSDVNAWPSWDTGLEKCELNGSFAKGSQFSLTPIGNEALTAELTEVIEGKGFSDITNLPFGSIVAIHQIVKLETGYQVTHKIIARIKEENAEMFSQHVWQGMKKGLPESVKNIVRLAEKKR